MEYDYYYVKLDYYGVSPPERARPFWNNNGAGYTQEDLIINSIDIQLSLQKLKEEEKEIVNLTNNGYSEREIANLRKVSQSKIHQIKENAFKHLRELLSTGIGVVELQTA
mgnify:CR=1 FL=1